MVEYIHGGVKSVQATKTLHQRTLTTTNSYVTGWTTDIRQFDALTFHIIEQNVNAIHYSIDKSMDSTDWHNVKTDQVIAKDGDAIEDIDLTTENWNFMRVQIKSAVGGTHSTDVDILCTARRST